MFSERYCSAVLNVAAGGNIAENDKQRQRGGMRGDLSRTASITTEVSREKRLRVKER